MQENSGKKFASLVCPYARGEEFASNQQLLGKFIGAGTAKRDKSFYYFAVQFLFNTVESCWLLALV